MAVTIGKATVTIPLYTLPAGSVLSEATVADLGLVHIGDATVEIPLDFQMELPLVPDESRLES